MKRLLFVTLAFVLLCTDKCFAQINSTLAGGNWADTLTWVGHVVPTANDNVIINGTVIVAAHQFADPRKCLNLQIAPTGKLYHPDTDWNLEVLGSVINNGIIQKIGLLVSGNIINAGYWKTSNLTLKSPDPHTIEIMNQGKMVLGQFSVLSGHNDSVIAMSDLRIDSSSFYSLKISLPAGRGLIIYGNNTALQTPTAGYGLKVYGTQGSIVRFFNNAWISAAKFTGVTLAGKVTLNGICELQNVTVTDTLTDAGYQANLEITTSGRFENTGKIYKSSGTWGFYIGLADTFRALNRISGVDFSFVRNGGLLECEGEGRIIRAVFSSNSPSLVYNFKNVILDSSLINLGGGKIIMTPGSVLRFSGVSVINTMFDGNDGVIISSPLSVVYQSYFSGCTLSNLTLAGTTQFQGTANFLRDVVNDGIIRNNGYQNNGGFTINGNFRNLGTVSKYSSYSTLIRLNGDLENFGILAPDYIYPFGGSICEVFSADTALISDVYLSYTDDSAKVVFVSPARLHNTLITAPQNIDAVLGLEGSGKLTFSGNSRADGIRFLGTDGQDIIFNSTPQYEVSVIRSYYENVCLKGRLFTFNSVYKNVVNKDTLTNTLDIPNQIQFEGEFLNESFIRARAGRTLNILVNGDLINAGDITVSQIDLEGSLPHLILLAGGKPIRSKTRFIHDNNNNGLWYLNNTPTVFTAPILVFDSVTVQKMGQYKHAAYSPLDTLWTQIFRIDTSKIPTGDIDEEDLILPTEFMLYQNFPNPFNPVTSIKYKLPISAKVEFKVYSAQGELILTISPGVQEAGIHTQKIDGSALASGIYLLRLEAGNEIRILKMILLK